MYDPRLGQWTSEDPLGFQAGDPNFYRYVKGAPTLYTDPTGLATVGDGQQSSNFPPATAPQTPLSPDKVAEGETASDADKYKSDKKPPADSDHSLGANQTKTVDRKSLKDGEVVGIGSLAGCTGIIVVPDEVEKPIVIIHVGPGKTIGDELKKTLEDSGGKSKVYVIYNKGPTGNPTALSTNTFQIIFGILSRIFSNIEIIWGNGNFYVDKDGKPSYRPPPEKKDK
jgi:hypothetical protein